MCMCVCVCVCGRGEEGAHARWKRAQKRIAHGFSCKLSVLFNLFQPQLKQSSNKFPADRFSGTHDVTRLQTDGHKVFNMRSRT
jgi:hypothetical protein